jgi:hypothetical protein
LGKNTIGVAVVLVLCGMLVLAGSCAVSGVGVGVGEFDAVKMIPVRIGVGVRDSVLLLNVKPQLLSVRKDVRIVVPDSDVGGGTAGKVSVSVSCVAIEEILVVVAGADGDGGLGVGMASIAVPRVTELQ